jgi:hypothetical protein
VKIYNEGRLTGILGTVIVHLIAGIIFISYKIELLKKDYSDKFQVEFTPVAEIPETKEAPKEPSVTSVEKIFQGDDEMLNIARNIANKTDVKINPSDYIDKVKEELIKSGKLGIDNYIDEQKRIKDADAEENLAFKNRISGKKEEQIPKESQEMAANYKGPTRIYYDLPRRNHTFLPIPVYKCQGSGKVVISIEVNQKGIVEKAALLSDQTSASDICLTETAVASALISRFNPDINAPKIQTGTLTYQFVAQ